MPPFDGSVKPKTAPELRDKLREIIDCMNTILRDGEANTVGREEAEKARDLAVDILVQS